ncbi:MAG: hypothetical protein Q8L68_01560 [Methylococcales bacterium]|nr:hypothetical protein [Methylococcales bacterium]
MFNSNFNPSKYAGEVLPILDLGSIPKTLRHITTIKGIFNNKSFELQGGGTGMPHEGLLDCKLISMNGPVHFPMPLMNVIAIFGYPTYSRHVNVYDIFKRSNGYEYERNIQFENGGFMRSLHTVRYSEDDNKRVLRGCFEVHAENVDVPLDIISLSPIMETFVPAGPGKVRSKFFLAWNTRSGKQYLANCESEYRLRHNLTLPQILFRHAEFVEDRSTPEMLDLDERIVVTDHFKVNADIPIAMTV